MSIASREDATQIAQQVIDRAAKIDELLSGLHNQNMLGLECGETAQLEKLSAETAAAAQALAQWILQLPQPLGSLSLVKPQICLTLVRPNSHQPVINEIGGPRVTTAMLEAAEDLLHTLTTGERQLPKDLYEVTARAFGTTRDDAKDRLIRAIYGGKSTPVPPPPGKPAA